MFKRFVSRNYVSLVMIVGAVLLAALSALAGGDEEQQKESDLSARRQDAPETHGRATLPPSPTLTKPETGVITGALVERDTATKQVRRVRGSIAVPGAHSAQEVADGFLRAHNRVLGLSNTLAELKPVRVVESLTGFHLTYGQVYAGLEVFGGQLSVHTDKNLVIDVVNHDLIPIARNHTITPPMDPSRATRAAVSAVKAPSGPSEPPVAQAGILIQNGAPVAVWKVNFPTRSPGASWEVMVSAENDQVLSVRNITQYYVEGSGMVFNPNPIQTVKSKKWCNFPR
jgi:Zn-dependent metalloprotease